MPRARPYISYIHLLESSHICQTVVGGTLKSIQIVNTPRTIDRPLYGYFREVKRIPSWHHRVCLCSAQAWPNVCTTVCHSTWKNHRLAQYSSENINVSNESVERAISHSSEYKVTPHPACSVSLPRTTRQYDKSVASMIHGTPVPPC